MADEEARCDITELYRSQCAHCLGQDKADTIPVGVTIRAKFEGECARNFRHLIDPGDPITRAEEGWICAACVEEDR